MNVLAFSILALVASLFTVASIVSIQLFFKSQRQRRFDDLILIPNILMTRYPLMFVGRPRSIFRISGDFFEMPIYMFEHGFQIEEVEMVDGRANVATLLRLLATNKTRVHLFVSEAFAEAAYNLAFDGHAKLATLTILGGKNRKAQPSELRPTRLPIFEKPELCPTIAANSFSTEEFALDHMVSLAEYDLR